MYAGAFAPTLTARPRTTAGTRAGRLTPRCALGKRALGVDYGLSRVGLAVSVGISPRPLARVETRDVCAAVEAVVAAARENLADEIVLGLPLNASGGRGEQAERTLAFATQLARASPTTRLLLVDERFTSQEADELLEGKPREERLAMRDSVAAAAILDRYFSERGEAAAEVFYEPERMWPVRGGVRAGEGCVQRQSFAEWKREKMQAAVEQEAELGGGKPVRRKRKGKRK